MTKLLMAALVGASLLFGADTSQAAATDLAARMMTPKSPYQTTDFDLGFVALDLKSNPVTVQCFLNGSGSPFQTINLGEGGTSGNCAVDSSVISGSGTYQFHIVASNGTDSVTSPDVSLDVVTGGPGTPTNYDRDKTSACRSVISFKTADDAGKTVRAEIYRSSRSTFTADASTLVNNIENLSSNQVVSYEDIRTEDCNTIFYAVRAFDVLGNGSGVVADERTVVRTTGGGTRTITTTVTAPGGGAIPVEGGAVAGETTGEEGVVEGVQTPSEEGEEVAEGEEEGQVLGEETGLEEPQSFFQKNKSGTILIILLLAAIAAYLYAKNKPKKGGLKPPADTPPTDSAA